MTDAERVVFAFFPLRKRCQAVFLLDRRDAVAPTGQDLVRIALMADVPDQPIAWRVEKPVQRDSELDDTEPGTEVAARRGDRFDEIRAQLARNLIELGLRNLAQVRGIFDLRKVWV